MIGSTIRWRSDLRRRQSQARGLQRAGGDPAVWDHEQVSVTALERRLRAIEARLAPLRPPAPASAWLSWVDVDDLDWAEGVLYEAELGTREVTEQDLLRFIEIEAAATRRMLAGEPPH